MLCFRLLNEDEPAAPLAAAVDALRQGQPAGNVFDVDPASFRQVPNAPFAYWVSERVRGLFKTLPAFEGEGRTIRVGLQTSDDFRFLRAAWETPASSERLTGWCNFVKGGSYSPFYADVFLRVNWFHQGKVLDAFAGSVIRNPDFYFRPGLTWPIKNRFTFKPWPLPAKCVFAHVGPSGFFEGDVFSYWGLMSSYPFTVLLRLMAGWNFEVGVVQRNIVPLDFESRGKPLALLSRSAWSVKRQADTANINSHAFFTPALARHHADLAEGLTAWSTLLDQTSATLSELQRKIDDIAYRLYGIGDEDRLAIEQILQGSTAVVSPELAESVELPEAEEEVDEASTTADAPALVAELLDYAVGVACGRWDVRYATGATPAPAEPDPFAALPVCAPGMLQNAAGLPAAPAEVSADYPLRITWAGILVDDELKSDDLVRRVQEVLEVIFPGRADAIADEACAILGARSLRDWFRSPAGFFAGHLKRHSKSRRQAPLYWPLSSPKGLYTVWLYLHRLTTDTFFTVLRDHVKPRLEDEERHVFNLKQQAGPSATPSQARDIATAEELVEDLRALRDELQRIAPLWRPDLNDGVIINQAPLWRLANHAPWRKGLKETWDSLVAGKYDWAHLALHLWPERVIPKCATDRSLAIAHGLEAFFWGADPKTGDVVALKRTEAEAKPLIAERTSPAVKDALDKLLTAPAPAGGATKRGRKKS